MADKSQFFCRWPHEFLPRLDAEFAETLSRAHGAETNRMWPDDAHGDLSMENVESTRKTCGFMGYTRDNNAVNLTANN